VPGLNRVLVTSRGQTGIWRYSVELARGFAQAGVEPVIAVLGPPPGGAMPVGVRVIATGLPHEATAPDAEALREVGATLAGLAARLHVDTIHLHTPALAAEVPWASPVVAVAHADPVAWWQAVRGGKVPDTLAWRAAAMARGLAEADAVVAPTRSFARALIRAHRPGRAISVIPHGRSHVPPPPCQRRRAVLTAGRLCDEACNVAALDRAAAGLDAPVFAAGAWRDPDGLPLEFARLTLLGELTPAALAAQMASTAVYAAPARYEPFGLAVLEAAQAGMALALADIPTFRELWEGAALFFHPEDAGGMTDVLSRLLSRPEAAAARAQRHAEKYASAAMVAATLALHRPLAAACAA
jgi:glycosyltransferase involved in cell wall biosynthesis